jgi:hypothetical protein
MKHNNEARSNAGFFILKSWTPIETNASRLKTGIHLTHLRPTYPPAKKAVVRLI